METKKKSVSEYVQEYGALIALIVLVVGIGIASPEFRTWSNFLSLLRQSSINGFIAFGMTCVILTDAIDLSVGSILGLSTALCAGMIASGFPVVPALILALVIGTGLGLISGILVTKGRAAGIYRNSCYNDCLPWINHDLHGWKTDFQPWRQLCTETGRKRKYLPHSDPCHPFCSCIPCILFHAEQNNIRKTYLCNRK